MRKKSKTGKAPGFGRLVGLVLTVLAGAASTVMAFAGQPPKTPEDRAPVRYTEVRQAAGITFLQDGTATDEKYYLETMVARRQRDCLHYRHIRPIEFVEGKREWGMADSTGAIG